MQIQILPKMQGSNEERMKMHDEPPEYENKKTEELEYIHLNIQNFDDFEEVDKRKKRYKANWLKRLKNYTLHFRSLMKYRIH